MNNLIVLTLVFATCLFSSNSSADDWSQWRGERRDGTWNETGLVDTFSTESLKPKWSQEIGAGYCGPTVADGRVLLMDRIVEPNQMERIHCFNSDDGKKQWTIEYKAPYQSVGYKAGPRASVSIDEGLAYALGTMGHVHCIKVDDGSIVWKRDLDVDYKIVSSKRMPIWGISASPLIYQNIVILHIGGDEGACIVGLDKKTGKEVWRALDDRAQYSSPIIIQQNGEDICVCWTGDSVAGIKPLTGEVVWRFPFAPSRMPIGVATPIVKDDRLFMTSFYDGSLMLKFAKDAFSVEKVWSAVGPNEKSTKALHSIIGTPIWIGSHIFGVDSYGEFRCIDANDGSRVWESSKEVPRARWSTIHFVRNGDNIWMFNERGDLILGQLSVDGFQEKCRAKIIEPTLEQLRRRGGVCWTHPAFANRCVFVRNDQKIVCVDLGSK